MNRLEKALLATIVFLVLLGMLSLVFQGCAVQSAPEYRPTTNEATLNTKRIPGSVTRFVDIEAGVVCWTFGAHGISCLPLSETKLEIAPYK